MYVYDCGEAHAEEIYDTFGQAFVVANKGPAKAARDRKAKPQLESIREVMDPRTYSALSDKVATLRKKDAAIPEDAQPQYLGISPSRRPAPVDADYIGIVPERPLDGPPAAKVIVLLRVCSSLFYTPPHLALW